MVGSLESLGPLEQSLLSNTFLPQKFLLVGNSQVFSYLAKYSPFSVIHQNGLRHQSPQNYI